VSFVLLSENAFVIVDLVSFVMRVSSDEDSVSQERHPEQNV
jgi:hypothetical protein